MRTPRSIAGPIAIAVLAVLLIPAAASAATKKIVIKPKALHPMYSLQGTKSGFGVSNAQYWATFKLPVNATISGLSFRRFATSVEETWVSLERVRVGASPSRQQIYEAAASDESPTGSTGHIVTGSPIPGAARKVTAGWDYYVHAGSSGAEDAQIVDITVTYRTP